MLVSQTSLVLDDCDSSADHWSGILQDASLLEFVCFSNDEIGVMGF